MAGNKQRQKQHDTVYCYVRGALVDAHGNPKDSGKQKVAELLKSNTEIILLSETDPIIDAALAEHVLGQPLSITRISEVRGKTLPAVLCSDPLHLRDVLKVRAQEFITV